MVDLLLVANLFEYVIVPQIPIIEGAGGVVAVWNGNSLGDEQRFETVLMSAHPTLHAAALELLQRH